jgi:hypothetical protein
MPEGADRFPTLAAVLLRVATLAIAVALLAAACGPPGPKVYDEAKSRACVSGEHLRVTAPPASDFIAGTALGGSFGVKLPKNSVTVSFGDTIDNAQTLDQAYRNVHARNVGIDDVLRMQGNAVMLWHGHPSDRDLGLVQNCLKT